MTDLAFFAATATAAGAVTGAEYAARAMLRRTRYRLHPPGMRNVIWPDPETHPQVERRISIEMNADGERGRPLPRTWGRTARVLVTGGSAVECFLVDQRTCWSGVLEEELARRGWAGLVGADDVYVGTLARSGVGTATLLGILRAVLPQYARLDAIVIMVGASDLLHWLEEGAPAGREPEPLPVPGIFAEHPEVSYAWRLHRLAFADLLHRIRTRLPRRPSVEHRAARWMGEARAMRRNAREVRDELPDPRVMLAGAERHMREVLRLARAAAPLVLVARQPWFDKADPSAEEEAIFWNGSVGSAFRSHVDVFYSHEVLRRLMSLLDQRLVEVCEEMDVPSLDARPRLSMNVLTFVDHFHLTADGCHTLGILVADQLHAMATGSGPTTPRNLRRTESPRRMQ